MAEIMLKIGNGYSCGCCRRTHMESVYANTLEEAIRETYSVVKGEDEFDFYVYRIIGEVDFEEDAIEEGVKQLELAYELQRKVERKRKDIKNDQAWLDNVESERKRRLVNITVLNQEIEELIKDPLYTVQLPE